MPDPAIEALERLAAAARRLSHGLVDVNAPHDRELLRAVVAEGLKAGGLRFVEEAALEGVARELVKLGRDARAQLGDIGLDAEPTDEHVAAAIWQRLELNAERAFTATDMAVELSRGPAPIWCPGPRAKAALEVLERTGHARRVESAPTGEPKWQIGARRWRGS